MYARELTALIFDYFQFINNNLPGTLASEKGESALGGSWCQAVLEESAKIGDEN